MWKKSDIPESAKKLMAEGYSELASLVMSIILQSFPIISVTLTLYLIRSVMEIAYLKVNWQRLFYRQLRNMPKLQLSA